MSWILTSCNLIVFLSQSTKNQPIADLVVSWRQESPQCLQQVSCVSSPLPLEGSPTWFGRSSRLNRAFWSWPTLFILEWFHEILEIVIFEVHSWVQEEFIDWSLLSFIWEYFSLISEALLKVQQLCWRITLKTILSLLYSLMIAVF
jgi:hypothetical protein